MVIINKINFITLVIISYCIIKIKKMEYSVSEFFPNLSQIDNLNLTNTAKYELIIFNYMNKLLNSNEIKLINRNDFYYLYTLQFNKFCQMYGLKEVNTNKLDYISLLNPNIHYWDIFPIPLFKLKEDFKPLRDYDFIKIIAKNANSTVFLVKFNYEIYVCKSQKLDNDFLKEVDLSIKMSNIGVSPFVYDYFIKKNKSYIVYEKLDYTLGQYFQTQIYKNELNPSFYSCVWSNNQDEYKITNFHNVDLSKISSFNDEYKSINFQLIKMEYYGYKHQDIHSNNIMYSSTKNKWYIIDYGKYVQNVNVNFQNQDKIGKIILSHSVPNYQSYNISPYISQNNIKYYFIKLADIYICNSFMRYINRKIIEHGNLLPINHLTINSLGKSMNSEYLFWAEVSDNLNKESNKVIFYIHNYYYCQEEIKNGNQGCLVELDINHINNNVLEIVNNVINNIEIDPGQDQDGEYDYYYNYALPTIIYKINFLIRCYDLKIEELLVDKYISKLRNIKLNDRIVIDQNSTLTYFTYKNYQRILFAEVPNQVKFKVGILETKYYTTLDMNKVTDFKVMINGGFTDLYNDYLDDGYGHAVGGVINEFFIDIKLDIFNLFGKFEYNNTKYYDNLLSIYGVIYNTHDDDKIKIQSINEFKNNNYNQNQVKNMMVSGPILIKNYLPNLGPNQLNKYHIFGNPNQTIFPGEIVPMTMKHGNQRNPRSILAIMPDDSLAFILIHGRSKSPSLGEGMTFQECIDLLIQIKVKFAINLDGGNSSFISTPNKVYKGVENNISPGDNLNYPNSIYSSFIYY